MALHRNLRGQVLNYQFQRRDTGAWLPARHLIQHPSHPCDHPSYRHPGPDPLPPNGDAGLEREAEVMGTKAVQKRRNALHRFADCPSKFEALLRRVKFL